MQCLGNRVESSDAPQCLDGGAVEIAMATSAYDDDVADRSVGKNREGDRHDPGMSQFFGPSGIVAFGDDFFTHLLQIGVADRSGGCLVGEAGNGPGRDGFGRRSGRRFRRRFFGCRRCRRGWHGLGRGRYFFDLFAVRSLFVNRFSFFDCFGFDDLFGFGLRFWLDDRFGFGRFWDRFGLLFGLGGQLKLRQMQMDRFGLFFGCGGGGIDMGVEDDGPFDQRDRKKKKDKQIEISSFMFQVEADILI